MAAPLADQLIGLGLPAPLANAFTSNIPQLVTAPGTAADSGTVGQIAVASGFIYVCVATDTWKRAALSTW